MNIYELTKWRKDNYRLGEETVAFYASWKDANLRKRYCEMNDNDVYDYCIYTRAVIPESGEIK